MPGRPQTAIDKFFTPFLALAIVVDQDVSSDAQFEGQNWQNLCFVFKGLTAARTLTLPSEPIAGMSVTAVDGDRSSNDAKTVTLAGNGNTLSGPSGSGSSLVAVQSAGGSTTVVFESTGWRVTDTITSGATGTGVTSTGTIPGTNVYGDGSDGAVVFDGTSTVLGIVPSGGKYKLPRAIYTTTLALNVGASLDCGGFVPYANVGATIDGHLHADGANASAPGGGAAAGGGSGLTSGTAQLAGGWTGGYGGASQAALANSMGGAGGASIYAGPFGAVRPAAEYGGARALLEAPLGILTGVTISSGAASVSSVAITGGNGGGGCADAGANTSGGGGGGVLYAKFLTLSGSGSITADGGSGNISTVSHDGSGGGGGGAIRLETRDMSAWTGSIHANGGAGGPGSNTTGSPGANGTVVIIIA